MISISRLRIVVFSAGAVVMTTELIGSRLLAPFVGTSVFVWTSLIGIILAGLSVGYWLGGKLADTGPNIPTLVRIILGAAFFISTISLFSGILAFIPWASLGIRFSALILSFILFVPAAILLGMVPSYVARFALTNIENAGGTIGSLSAYGTIGSIVGTFLGGFFLVSYLAVTHIFILLSFILLILAYGIGRKEWQKPFSIVVLAIVLLTVLSFKIDTIPLPRGATLKEDVTTPYGRFWVYDTSREMGEVRRVLANTLLGSQSAIYPNNPDTLAHEYTKLYDLFSVFNPKASAVLMIGGGAYSYPRHFLNEYPEGELHVVELDPEATRLAKQYFFLMDDPRLTVTHTDGRVFLNNNTTVFDAILVDAFSSSVTIPFHLATKETVEKIYSSLSPEGVAIVNIISALEGPRDAFLASELKTYESVFPHVTLFQVNPTPNLTSPQNVMLVAHKKPLDEESMKMENNRYFARVYPAELISKGKVLTDQFAPVENLAEPLYIR